MAGPFDFTGQNIENTYQRVLQTDGTNVYDGTGSLFTLPSVNTSSLATTGSNTFIGNQIISGAVRFDPTQDPDTTGLLHVSSSFLFQSASNTSLGYDLYIRQDGNLVKWKWIEGVMSTGLLYGGVVTYSGTEVYVSSGSGIIVEHNAVTGSEISPTITYVNWPDITQSIANIATQQVTYLYIDQNGDLQQQANRFTGQQYHDYIPLGAVGHFDYTQVSAFGGGVQTAYDQTSQILTFISAFGPLKVSGYGISGQAGSLRLTIGSGTSFIHGGFYENNPEFPSEIDTPTQLTAIIARVYRSGSSVEFDTNGGSFYTEVDPTQYDRDGDGTLEPVGSGNWTIQRVYSDPKTGILYIYYGQERYTTLLNALQYLPTDPFTEGDTFDFTTFIGYLVLKGNTSDITDTNNNSIIPGGLFRGAGGGGGGGGGATVPGGSNGEIQYNNLGAFGGVPTLTYDGTTLRATGSFSGSLQGTASYADNGGVTGITAGNGISINQSTGNVTITSIATSYNTATGSYGSFYDTTTQTNPVINVPRSMSINTTDISNGVSISGSTNPYNTYVKVTNAGVYDIQFSAQFDRTTTGTDIVYIWLRKNGVDVPQTNTSIVLTGGAAANPTVAAWNWFVNANAGDYYQLMWSAPDTHIQILATTPPYGPAVPSIILTVNRVDTFLSNTGSFSGSFTGEFFGVINGGTF